MIFEYLSYVEDKMHKEFSEIYDVFMKHVDYDQWYKFLRNYIKKRGKILDLGCGTGQFAYRFLKDGYSVTGIDLSETMLNEAEKKLKSINTREENYKLIKENLKDYLHPEKVDYIICNFDTVNYLKNEDEFIKFIERSSENLRKGGYLIFDAVTEDIFEEIFENGIFLDEEPEYTSIWRHEQIGKNKHLIEIDLFVRQDKKDNLFRKYNERQYKFIYELEWIISTALEKGFEILDTASNPELGESRIFFIFRKS